MSFDASLDSRSGNLLCMRASNYANPGKELSVDRRMPASYDVIPLPLSRHTHMRFCLDVLARTALEIRSHLAAEGPYEVEIKEIKEICDSLQYLTHRGGLLASEATEDHVDDPIASESHTCEGHTSSTKEDHSLPFLDDRASTTQEGHVDFEVLQTEVKADTVPANAEETAVNCTDGDDAWIHEEPWKKVVIEAFKQIDTDGSGKISTRELCGALEAVKIPRARSIKLIQLADRDDSGEIDFSEWVSAVKRCNDKDMRMFYEQYQRLVRHSTLADMTAKQQQMPDTCMLHPISIPRLLWDLIMALACLYLAVTLPFLVAFEGNLKADTVDTFQSIDRVLDILFAFDILLNFRTGYVVLGAHSSSTSVEMHWKRVAKHYIRTWLFFDVISAFPFSVILPSSTTDTSASKIMKVYRLMKLLKLAKGLPFYRHLEGLQAFEEIQKFVLVRFFTRKGYIFLMMILLCHVMACIMKLVDEGFLTSATMTADMEYTDLTREYIAAFYWCMTTLTTVGYGDITPVSNSERVFAVVAMVIGGVFYGIVVGSISSMVAEQNLNDSAYYQRIDLIYAWTLHHQLPAHVRWTVCRFFRHHLAQRSAISEGDVWEDLSDELQIEVGSYIVEEDVRHNPLFDNVSLSAVVKLQSVLNRCLIVAGRSIVCCGDAGATMYIISSGLVEQAFPRDREKAKRTLLPGQSFGEGPVLGFEDEYDYDASTLEDSTLETIKQDSVMQVFNAMPHVLERMRQNAILMHPHLRQRVNMSPRADKVFEM
eukprot:TRINITY_DN3286_c0_g2_i1.p1 TRINITY_DN3286_c0_g2~~TRINITY_DN3286_c0_g2_i1.p1  ORF type:complete len:766 (+),score=107.41 TRINITY_DN3286_c0_g2_i1:44-2341(+)